MEWDVRKVMKVMMEVEGVVGFLWVMEWREEDEYDGEVVLWVDGSKSENRYGWGEEGGL